ncbi:MAG TPA: hypothetical protein VE398_03675 [Acidobacteriota bacterium]|nr:hypothetical protein [Acidobacteriota bacterium]
MLIPKSGAWILVFVFGATAIAKPNFTGTWVRDASASGSFTEILNPVIGPSRSQAGPNFILRVSHRGKRLQVTVEQDASKPIATTYDLGRGWHGSFLRDFGGMQYRSSWKGDTLVIEKYVAYRGNFGDMRGDLKQNWALSPGGDIMIITTTRNGVIAREVFKRK